MNERQGRDAIGRTIEQFKRSGMDTERATEIATNAAKRLDRKENNNGKAWRVPYTKQEP